MYLQSQGQNQLPIKINNPARRVPEGSVCISAALDRKQQYFSGGKLAHMSSPREFTIAVTRKIQFNPNARLITHQHAS